MPQAKVTTDLVVHDGQFNRAMKGAIGTITSVGTAAKSLALSVSGILGVGAVFTYGIKAASDAEAGYKKLGAVLKELGADNSFLDTLKASASQIQQNTKHSDDYILSLYTMGLGMGVAKESIVGTTNAALQLAAATGKDAKMAMETLAKASAGDHNALVALIPAMKDVTDAAKKQEIVNAALARGQAILSGESDSYSGQLARLWGSITDVAKAIGLSLLPYVTQFSGWLAESLPTINRWVGTIIGGFAKVLAFTAPVLNMVVDGWRKILDWGLYAVAGVVTAWEGGKDTLNLVGVKISLGFVKAFENIKYFFADVLPAYLAWFIENWRDVFSTAASFLENVFTNMAYNAGEFFKALWAWINGEGFAPEWRGLTEGFENTMKALPTIAEREMSGLERSLTEQADSLGKKFASRFDETLFNFRSALGLEPAAGVSSTVAVSGQLADAAGFTLGDPSKKQPEKKSGGGGAAGQFTAIEELNKRISAAASKSQQEKDTARTADATEKSADVAEETKDEAKEHTKLLGDIREAVKNPKPAILGA